MEISSNIKIAILAVGLFVGAGIKLYLGSSNPVEMEAEAMIESVVKSETGIDLTPVLS